MSKKGTPSAPAAPDPVATAAAQTASNVETARKNAELNRVNQFTPQGSLTYSKVGPSWDEQAYLAANPDVAAAVTAGQGFKSGQEHFNKVGRNEGRTGVPAGYAGEDQWQATVSYSPEQQRLYDLSTQAQTLYGETGLAQLGKLREQMSTPFQFSGAPEYQPVSSRAGEVATSYDTGGPIQRNIGDAGTIQRSIGADDFSADRRRVEEALYGRLDPSLNQQRTALEARLRSQGLAPGSEAWTNAMRAQAQSETDARLGVVAAGGQEQSRLFGMDQAKGQFANTAQGQAYEQLLAGGQFANAAQGQAFTQAGSLAAFGAQAAQQRQNMDMSAGQYSQQIRQQMLAEQLAIRTQPLNETSALLTGQQVQNPQFQNVPQVQVAPTDYISAVGQQQAALQSAYKAKNEAYVANVNGLYRLGGSVISGGMSMGTGGAAPPVPTR